MKELRGKIVKAVEVVMLISAFFICMCSYEIASDAVSDAVERCLTVVIPSLYAMMIISSLIVKSGVLTYMPKSAGRLSFFLFGMDEYIAAIFAFSVFAGYPVGISMLLAEYEKGRLSKRRAELLAGLCFGAGPAFIFGCVSGRLYSSSVAGLIIMISVSSANIILAMLISPLLRKENTGSSFRVSGRLNADMLTESILSGGGAMAGICFTITAFSVISAYLSAAGLPLTAGEIISHFADITAEIAAALFAMFLDVTDIASLPQCDYTILPYISAVVSFGGVCVMFQLSALIHGRISMKPLIIMRITAAAFSGIICRIITPFFMRHELYAVSSANIRLHSSASPVPSVMLIIMTFMLFLRCKEYHEKQ